MGTAVVLASQGQLGSLLLRELRGRGEEAVGVDRDICDFTDAESVKGLFARFPQMERLYNAAAFTAVDEAEDRRRVAFQINALGPGLLASCAALRGIELVHFSTDYVFGEGHEAPIDEGGSPAPLSAYGQSKLLGEELVMRHHPGAFVFRTSGLYSSHRPNFLRTMAQLALSRDRVQVVADQIVSPTRASTLARTAIEVVEKGRPGLYHATSQGQCSWHEFASALFEELHIGVGVQPVPSSAWPTRARRPPYSALDNGALRRQGLDGFTHWRVDLQDFLSRHGEALLKQCSSLDGTG